VLHPATQLRYINDAIGYGVFTTAFIPRGTFVWVLDAWDRILSPPAVAALPRLLRQQVEKYAYINAAGDYVLCWDFGCYMNHSCEPTSLGLGESIEVAIRDIEPGEELTCEYATLNLTTAFACGCHKQTCRKLMARQTSTALGSSGIRRWPNYSRRSVRSSNLWRPLSRPTNATGRSWMASSSAPPSHCLPREIIKPAKRRNRRANH